MQPCFVRLANKESVFVESQEHSMSHIQITDTDNPREIIRLLVADSFAQHAIYRAFISIKLCSLYFPRSFPIDAMHCMLLNTIQSLEVLNHVPTIVISLAFIDVIRPLHGSRRLYAVPLS